MNAGSDNGRDTTPPPEPYAHPASEPTSRTKPFTGGYYWLPTPASEAGDVAWSVITCRDLGCNSGAGHDAELWPRLMELLAAAWSKDVPTLKRRLALCYTGLPRGRVTHFGKQFLILYGNDSPVPDWLNRVREAFSLNGRRVKTLFDEHETMIPGHPRAVEAALSIGLAKLTAQDPSPTEREGRHGRT